MQIRIFLAMSIFVYSIRSLCSDRKTDILKYIYLILIATSVHSSAIFFLPLFLLKDIHSNWLIVFVFMISVLGCFFAYSNLIYEIVLQLSLLKKIVGWFDRKARFGFMVLPNYLLYCCAFLL